MVSRPRALRVVCVLRRGLLCGFSRRSCAESGFGWRWPGEEEALAVFGVCVAEPVGLVFVLDAFADHREAEGVGGGDDESNEFLIDGVG